MPPVAVFNVKHGCSPQPPPQVGGTGVSALKRRGTSDPLLKPIISQANIALQTLIPDSASNMTYRSETGTLEELCTCFFQSLSQPRWNHKWLCIVEAARVHKFKKTTLCTPLLDIVL